MSAIKRRLVIFLSVMLLILGLMFTTVTHAHFKRKGRLVLGAKDTTGQILSEIIAQLLEEKVGLLVERKPSLDGTFICFNALNTKEIDMYVEYTGTALTAILHKDWAEVPPHAVFDHLQEEFSRRFDLKWMSPFGFESAYVIVVHPEFAKKHELRTFSELQKLLKENKKIRVAFDPEFYARPEEKILESEYDMQFSNLKLLDHTLLYLALLNHSVDVINGYATDGFIFDHGLIILEDDEKRLPPYEAAAIVRCEILKMHPEIQDIFEEISGKITLSKICEMNYKVEKKGESVYHIAQQFLKREGYLSHP